jgi:hypothetical protein
MLHTWQTRLNQFVICLQMVTLTISAIATMLAIALL